MGRNTGMTVRGHRAVVLIALLWGSLGDPNALAAQEADAASARVELMLIQANGRTKGFSLSLGHGAFVEGQSIASDGAVATGVIASNGPVGLATGPDGSELFTSDVGTTIHNGSDRAAD